MRDHVTGKATTATRLDFALFYIQTSHRQTAYGHLSRACLLDQSGTAQFDRGIRCRFDRYDSLRPFRRLDGAVPGQGCERLRADLVHDHAGAGDLHRNARWDEISPLRLAGRKRLRLCGGQCTSIDPKIIHPPLVDPLLDIQHIAKIEGRVG